MEKNGAVAIGASKATGEEAHVPVQAPAEALKEAVVPVQTLVPASAVAAGEEALAYLGQISLGWDPYDEDYYIMPENPYDTSITDPWSEEDNSDDESKDTKTRHVLRRLKFGQYDNFFVRDIYRCPFCTTRRLHATDFNSLVKHAEDMRTYGKFMNIHGFRTKHQALGLYLHNLQKMAIEEGRMPPIKLKVKGRGSKKWSRRHREEAEALLAEAMRGH